MPWQNGCYFAMAFNIHFLEYIIPCITSIDKFALPQVINKRSNFVWISIWVIASYFSAHTFYLLKFLRTVSLVTLENIDNIDSYRQNLWSGKQYPRVEKFDNTTICVKVLMLRIAFTYCWPYQFRIFSFFVINYLFFSGSTTFITPILTWHKIYHELYCLFLCTSIEESCVG